MESIINGLVQNNSDKLNIILSNKLPNSNYTDLWIRIVNKSNIDVRKIKEYNPSTKTVILEYELRDTPTNTTKYDIGDFAAINKNKYIEVGIISDGANQIKLTDNAKKIDKIYNTYWVKIISGDAINNVRQVKNYINNTLTLDYDLPKSVKDGDKILLLPHYFNDYIMLGIIDFTNFLGMDFSGLIDGVGGLFNFQLTTAGICILSSIILVVIVLLIIKKPKGKKNTGGLFVPGLGRMGAQQPLVIQMPMQTKPYPYNDSPFPRDT